MIVDNTPVEQYGTIWVKREDLSCPDGPMFSKVRGIAYHIRALVNIGVRTIGVLDTFHSKAGWGVAQVCKELGLECVDFYPEYVGSTELRETQLRAAELGAQLIPLKAGMSAVLWNIARRCMRDLPHGYLMPNGLRLSESVSATADELIEHLPASLLGGTLVVSVSSGTIARGVARGLNEVNPSTVLVAHMGYSRSEIELARYLEYKGKLVIIDEGYAYRDRVDEPCPFPCNPYYDLKAWKWLQRNLANLEQPVVFWNIGA